jgi:phosphogluconate dehydratase
MLMEAMGLHVPGTASVQPGDALRANSRAGGPHPYRHHKASALRPSAMSVDERAIVNAMVALLATGGSTNHLP